MSIGPNFSLETAKAASTATLSTMSATWARTCTPGCLASRSFLVFSRVEAVRPITVYMSVMVPGFGRCYIFGCTCYVGGICDGNLLVIFVAPDVAKAWAIPGPIPDPPPVMNTDFPAVESSGRVTDIAGYGAVCHDLVKGGKAIASLKTKNVLSWDEPWCLVGKGSLELKDFKRKVATDSVLILLYVFTSSLLFSHTAD